MTAAAVLDDDRPPPSLPEAAAAPAQPSASDRLRQLAILAIDRLAGAAAAKVEQVADRLGDMAADAAKGAVGQASLSGLGVGATAALEAGRAKLEGRNPVWAGIKGGVGAMSPGQKVLLGLALLLTAVLSPVALIVLALVLLVAAIVGAVSG
jgi:hypothetical protein